MRRRTLLAGATGTLLALPRRARAQAAGGAPVVAYLGLASPASDFDYVAGLRLGLAELGHVEGGTIVVLDRYADGSIELLGRMLAEVTDQGAAVVVVPGIAAALAVRKLAPQMPIVAVGLPSSVVYPDLVASLHRPGGSVTGFSPFGEGLAAKRVELLKEVVPALTTVAILHNTIDPLYRDWGEQTEQAALGQGLLAVRLGVESPSREDLAALLDKAQAAGATGLIVVRDFLTHMLQGEVARAANAMGMATMAEQRSFVDAGGLMAYGADLPELFRRAATYVEQILEGADPALMPVQLATRFELVVNLQSAAALGIDVPQSILLRADEVIE
jgi:putative tryptophan/tyrosine transport system substrate-binding protein